MENQYRLCMPFETPADGSSCGFLYSQNERFLVQHDCTNTEKDKNKKDPVRISLLDKNGCNCMAQCTVSLLSLKKDEALPDVVKNVCSYELDIIIQENYHLGGDMLNKFWAYLLRFLRENTYGSVCLKVPIDSDQVSFYKSLGFVEMARVDNFGTLLSSSIWKFTPSSTIDQNNSNHTKGNIYFVADLKHGEDALAATDWNPATKICYAPTEDFLTSLVDDTSLPFLGNILLCTAPEPWNILRGSFESLVTKGIIGDYLNHDIKSMDESHLKMQAEKYKSMDKTLTCILGIGGGSACDTAKYMSYFLELPLILIPSILSVDAPFTRAAGIRVVEAGRVSVQYVGDCSERLRAILLDFELLRKAPLFLNLSGVGDLLSIVTAQWDWRYTAESRGEAYSPSIASKSMGTVSKLYASALPIRDLNKHESKGLRYLAECFAEEVRLCEEWGNSRPEEGSEHYLAYALESSTGRGYIHGRLIGLCTTIVSIIQGWVSHMKVTADSSADGSLLHTGSVSQFIDHDAFDDTFLRKIAPATLEVSQFLRHIGLDCDFGPSNGNPTMEEVRRALFSLPSFLEAENQLLPGVFHIFGEAPPYCLNEELVNAVIASSHKLLKM